MSKVNGSSVGAGVSIDQNPVVKLHTKFGAMGSMPRLPTFTDKLQEREYVKFRLAQALRIFGNLGYDEGVAGHITARDPIKTDCFWVNPFGVHFKLIHAADLILVDHSCNVLDEESYQAPVRLLNRAAFMIHSAIHSARPDVMCAAHSHSVYGRAYTTLGKELDMITQDSCAFYKDHAVYRQFRGVVLDEVEGKNIAEALGNKKAALLQNHGLLVATDTIEATIHYYIALEKSCQAQLMADAAGQTIKIDDEEALNTYKTVGTLSGGWFSGRPQFMLLEANEGLRFDFGKTYAKGNGETAKAK